MKVLQFMIFYHHYHREMFFCPSLVFFHNVKTQILPHIAYRIHFVNKKTISHLETDSL